MTDGGRPPFPINDAAPKLGPYARWALRASLLSVTFAARRTKFYWPVPLNGTVCGLPPPLSVTDSAAERAPVAVGVKVTLMAQLVLPAIPLPQVLVWAKSAAFGPV